MWSKLKALPLLPKVLLAILILGIVYKAGTAHQSPRPSPFREAAYGDDSQRTPDASGEPNQMLAQFQAQQAQLMARVRQCQQQMTEATNEMARAAMNGQMDNNRPPCEQAMPQWIAQEAYLETEIYRIQTGDHSSSLRQITGIAPPSSSPSNASRSSNPDTGNPDDGINAVDNFDREAIRGNSLYADENGEQHELPTRSYYFRDRASGQIIGSDTPQPPSDGRDYEQLTYTNHPQ